MLTLPPDYTFLIQLATFFVLLALLRKLLFEPFMALLDERAQKTTGDIAKAERSRAEVQALSTRVDAELAKARAAAGAEIDTVRGQARQEAARLLTDAQNEAGARLAELRGEVATATREARTQLAGDAKSLADAMVAAVLGGSLQ
ncbi:MAG TPA: ATP synthase F0 subunit B [Candidatus Binatia bacterium]|jgi:F-type H+-transporting ATPase subunit b